MRLRLLGLPMRHHELKELAGNPNFISGIYNYCDRWCERCAFTSRCMLYATEQADPDANDPEMRDITNEKFWRKLHEIFADTAAMISEWAAEMGVDLNSVGATEDEAHEHSMELARNDERTQTATEYAEAVQRWFADEFDNDESIHSDAPIAEPEIDISDATEVIRWYQFFIAVKLTRALTGANDAPESYLDDEALLTFDFESTEDDDDFDYDDVIPRSSAMDANGTTKTALIAIDRSIGAWCALQDALPEKAETIKPLVIQLERLRLSVEQRFPRARDFVRPGLDELLSEFAN